MELRERRYYLQGRLEETRRELEALDIKGTRCRGELNRLLNPFEPLIHVLKIIDLKAIEQTVRELKDAKELYDAKLLEIKALEKELGGIRG